MSNVPLSAEEILDGWYEMFAQKKKDSCRKTMCCLNNCFGNVDLKSLKQLLYTMVPLRVKDSPMYDPAYIKLFASTVVGCCRREKSRCKVYALPFLKIVVCVDFLCNVLGITHGTLNKW